MEGKQEMVKPKLDKSQNPIPMRQKTEEGGNPKMGKVGIKKPASFLLKK